jgi:hypothetical protein
LRSIFETNINSLKYTLGGILNRKLYTIPCRRDLDVDSNVADKIQDTYEECMKQRGVVLTVPEHRLSFQLKGYEMALRKDSEYAATAKAIMNVQLWLNSNARDILDESDELLNAKYQLVYTVAEMELSSGTT